MKKFVIKFVCFAVLVYVLAWGLDWVLCEGQKRVGGYPQQPWAEIRNGGIDADVIVMGNSRALEHFDPAVLDSVTNLSWYNLGMGGYPVNVELMKYHCYRAHNKKTKYIVYQVDWMTMAMGSILRGHQAEQFYPLVFDSSVRKETMSIGYTWKEITIPLYRWFGDQTHIKRSLFALGGKHYPDIPCYKGFAADLGEWDPANLQIADSIETSMSPEAQQMFEVFLQECKDEGVSVIMVNSPMYAPAYRMQKHNPENEAYFERLSQKYNIPYRNFNDNNSMWQDSTLFNAGVHLNGVGAKKFSKIMGEEFRTKD